MAFPSDPLDVTVEIQIDGTWTDISDDVLTADGITITRGRRDEGTQADPSTCVMTIKNTDGTYSPRNPTSAYFGEFGRNTPIRVKVGTRTRFVGEVSSWPQRWGPAGALVRTPIEAAGILRRLGQGAEPLASPMRRGLLRDTDPPVGYWPCEDADGATSLASAVGGPPMTIVGSPGLAGFDQFAASAPIPTLSDSQWTGMVPAYTPTGEAQIRFLLAVPSGGATDGQTICRIRTSGTAHLWHLNYGTDGALELQAFGDDGGLLDTGEVAFAIDGLLLRVSIELKQDGDDIDWNMLTLEPGADSGLSWSGTLTGATVGQIQQVIISPEGGIDDTAVGHVSVQSAITDLFDLGGQLNAWRGETAGNRIKRLCTEEGVTFTDGGYDMDDTVAMGAQGSRELTTLLAECADADAGLLYEPRTAFGLGYRPRSSLYNQTAAVALDYDDGEVAQPLDPVDDDQLTRNDVTVARDGGSSARATLDDGPLSTAAPPDGVGRYPDELTINLASDAQLPDQASWRLHLGTVDEARYPQITVNLASDALTGDSTLTGNVLGLDVGDRITIDNAPDWLPPGLISQLALGYEERIGNFEHALTFNCTPESPYQVGIWGTGRYSPASSTISEDLTTTETDVSVATSTGPLWTTDDDETPFDVMIGGERMTVTDISGTSSPQTFTVTRSVNGIVKAHSTGEAVTLFAPAVRAL